MLKIKSVLPKIRNKSKMFALATPISHSTKSPSVYNETCTNKNKKHICWKGRHQTVSVQRLHDLHRKPK